MIRRGSEEPCPKGDRASVVAKKRGNARGANGGRKVETLNKRTKENNTANEMREICLKTHNTGCRRTKNGAQRWG
jgi:hypothetical protein